jgi:hypothetical protein
LKDHGDLAAANGPHVTFRRGDDVAALVENLPGEESRRRHGQQLEDAHRGDGLAAARFADQCDSLPGINGEIRIADGPDEASRGVEADVQVLDFKKR